MNAAPPPFDALVFDLDGTLIDSAPDVRAAANRMLAAEGRRLLSLPEVKDLIGQGGRVLVEKALAMTGRPGTPEEIERTFEGFLTTYAGNPAAHTTVYPGAREALESLSADGVRLGICTNKPCRATAAVLEALSLDRFFTVVSCGDAVPHKKPDGRHVLHVIEALGATRDTAAMIGDSENDINAARDAGVRSVAVTFGYAHVPHAELGADALIDRFEDLTETLSRIAASVH
ncbi:MAG: phosphoglycolate phosphatase [Rhodospirillales bacterium]